MKRASAFLAVVGLFVLGVVAGSAATHLFYVEKLEQPGRRPHLGGRAFGDQLLRTIDLDDDQLRRIDEIVDRSHREAAAIRGELGPRVRELFETTNQQIREVLSEDQRERYDRLRAEHRRRAEQYLLGPGGRPSHGPPHRRGEHRRRHRELPPPEGDG